MSWFSAQELAKTVDCKVTGCRGEATSARGRQQRLCDEHLRPAALARKAASG